jgi:hypothetical protein
MWAALLSGPRKPCKRTGEPPLLLLTHPHSHTLACLPVSSHPGSLTPDSQLVNPPYLGGNSWAPGGAAGAQQRVPGWRSLPASCQPVPDAESVR